MIIIPWIDDACAMAYKEVLTAYGEVENDVDFGYLFIDGDQARVYILSEETLDAFNDAFIFDFNNEFSCGRAHGSDKLGNLFDIVAWAKTKRQAKLWVEKWVPITQENLFESCLVAGDIARCFIYLLMPKADIEWGKFFAALSNVANLPPVAYRWNKGKLELKCRDSERIMTLEDYLSLLP